MNYHDIKHDNMLNGEGLRVVLFVSGCNHHCFNCQNPQTWDCNSGIEFDDQAMLEIKEQLENDYISGITFSGGDPLHENNIETISGIVNMIKSFYPTKTIWLYTGYTWEELNPMTLYKGISEEDNIHNLRSSIIKRCDVLVEGRFVDALNDINYPWAGSTNQRIIDIKQSFQKGVMCEWGKQDIS